VLAERPSNSLLQGSELVVYDAKALRVPAVDDVLIAAYLIEPGRAAYELGDLAAEYGVEVDPDPPADEETAALIRRAALPLRMAPRMRERLAERRSTEPDERVELPLTQVLAAMEDVGVDSH